MPSQCPLRSPIAHIRVGSAADLIGLPPCGIANERLASAIEREDKGIWHILCALKRYLNAVRRLIGDDARHGPVLVDQNLAGYI